MLFTYILRHLITHGTLRLISGANNVQSFGRGAPYVTLRLRGWRPGFFLTLRPDLKIAKTYGEGRLTIEQGSLRDLRYLLFINYEEARKRPFFKFLDMLAGERRKSAQTEIIKKIYGFLPENKYLQVRRGRKWSSGARALFAKPWHKLFHMRRSWGGMRLLPRFRKRAGIAAPVTLSVAQYRTRRQQPRPGNAGQAYLFHLSTGGLLSTIYIATIRTQRRQYIGSLKQLAGHIKKHTENVASSFDQYFQRQSQFRPVKLSIPPSQRVIRTVRIHLGAPSQIMPWTRDHIHQWEKSTCGHSDNFVRQETS